MGGAGTGPEGERHLSKQEAAVHRHSLDRLNTINDSPPQKEMQLGQARARPPLVGEGEPYHHHPDMH